MSIKDYNNGIHVYNLLEGKEVNVKLKTLYKLSGKKYAVIATMRKGDDMQIVGINMYYYNERDINDGTIHEGFIGVKPEVRGRGIATNLRKISLEHYLQNNHDGISTRISVNNIASLQSSLKLGFKPIEKYFDPVLSEYRYYLVHKFSKNKHNLNV